MSREYNERYLSQDITQPGATGNSSQSSGSTEASEVVISDAEVISTLTELLGANTATQSTSRIDTSTLTTPSNSRDNSMTRDPTHSTPKD